MTSAEAEPQGSRGPYRRSKKTRERILNAAIRCFAAAGLNAVTTREIAAEADVSLPSLSYYFGGKKALHRACAEKISDAFSEALNETSQAASKMLDDGMSSEQAREALRKLSTELTLFFLRSGAVRNYGLFMHREITNDGEVRKVLQDKVWNPGIEIVARLIARIIGREELDNECKLDALFLTSSITSVSNSRDILDDVLKDKAAEEKFTREIIAGVMRQIDRL